MSSPESTDRPASPTQTSVEDAAIAWLAERDDGFSTERAREFAAWLDANPQHVAAVARLEKTLDLLGELPQFRAELNTTFERPAPIVLFPEVRTPTVRFGTPLRKHLRMWTSVAALLVLGLTFGGRARWFPAATRYTTTVAGYERAHLEDGSTLELNAASAARVHFTRGARDVDLESGEAYFAVAHDTARPFIVHAGEIVVRAVGTAFNVRHTAAGGIEVIVAEGKVRVSSTRAASVAIEPSLVGAGERVLSPLSGPLSAVERVAPATLRTLLAWQSPLVEFADAPLATVIERFNARSRVQLTLADPALGRRLIGGTFALNESEAFVRLLTRNAEIVAEPRGDNEILLRAGP